MVKALLASFGEMLDEQRAYFYARSVSAQLRQGYKETTVDQQLERLDAIVRQAWEGKYEAVGPLSTGERLYVALASGRMRELAPGDSIPSAIDRVGPEWMAHMLQVWKYSPPPRL